MDATEAVLEVADVRFKNAAKWCCGWCLYFEVNLKNEDEPLGADGQGMKKQIWSFAGKLRSGPSTFPTFPYIPLTFPLQWKEVMELFCQPKEPWSERMCFITLKKNPKSISYQLSLQSELKFCLLLLTHFSFSFSFFCSWIYKAGI